MPPKGEQTRSAILEAAAKLFELKGFRSTSLSDLQQATGLHKGTLYFHFKNKEDIGFAVLAQAQENLEQFLTDALIGAGPCEKLERYFKKIIDWQRDLNFCGGCIFGNIALEMGDSDERFVGFVDRVFNRWIEHIELVISEGQVIGVISSDLSSKAIARHIVATTEGAIMLSRLKKNDQPLVDCFDYLRQSIPVTTP